MQQLSTQGVQGEIITLHIEMQRASSELELNLSREENLRERISAMTIRAVVYQQVLDLTLDHFSLSCSGFLIFYQLPEINFSL